MFSEKCHQKRKSRKYLFRGYHSAAFFRAESEFRNPPPPRALNGLGGNREAKTIFGYVEDRQRIGYPSNFATKCHGQRKHHPLESDENILRCC